VGGRGCEERGEFARDLHTLLQAGSMESLPARTRREEQRWSSLQFAQPGGRGGQHRAAFSEKGGNIKG
jgi:hypothetical protein